MNLKKTTLSTAIAIALGCTSFTVSASLTTSATLDFILGTVQTVSCNYGTTPPCTMAAFAVTDLVGSYFSVDSNGDGSFTPGEKTPIGSLNGIHIGTIQAASGSHVGPIDGSETPNIDNPFIFAGNTGMHMTTSPITVISDSGSTKTLDMSGWAWNWDGIDEIPFVDLGTTITCDTSSCSNSSNYTIDGTFHINGAGITSVGYILHLEGHVSNIPVPAAAWLFGSGLLGLIGIARCKKAA